MNYSLKSYKKIEAETTDPITLIVMLFEGAINFTEQAKQRINENDIAAKGILISKVMAIVSELQSSLNMEAGGEVAQNMDRIYSYIRNRLYDANLNNDLAILDEALNHFRVLKDAWVKARTAEAKEEGKATEKSTTPEAATQQQATPRVAAAAAQPYAQAPRPKPQPQPSLSVPVASTGQENNARPAIEIVG